MIERAALAAVIVTLLTVGYVVGARWQVRSIGRRKSPDRVLSGLRPGIPAVIYFWSETCAPCKTVQKPALERLQAELGPDGIQVVAINAVEQPGTANAWGVLGVPTTFIIDAKGQPRRVNHGVARAEHLREQIKLVV